jgi:hypothetical protein
MNYFDATLTLRARFVIGQIQSSVARAFGLFATDAVSRCDATVAKRQ